jgi:hypothetical protein
MYQYRLTVAFLSRCDGSILVQCSTVKYIVRKFKNINMI